MTVPGKGGRPKRKNHPELLELLNPELREKVEKEGWSCYEGQNPAKPVVLDEYGRIAKGSGRWPNANDPGLMGKLTGYKKSETYRQALETLVPMDGDENRRGSFAWWLQQGMEAAEGSPQRVQCNACGKPQVVAFKKDGNLIFKIVELLSGKAKETQDINLKSQQLIAVLNERTPLDKVHVFTIDEE